jgi:predicted GIY-YIG superfamily endonuclease
MATADYVLSETGRAEFAAAQAAVESHFRNLIAAPKQRFADQVAVPSVPGVYLFSESGRPMYVGQSRNLRRRLRIHTRPTSTHYQASFAFNLAKREALAAGVDVARKRAALAADHAFEVHFAQARASVAGMTVQYVAVPSPITRTMLEMYASLALGTAEFNSFETH